MTALAHRLPRAALTAVTAVVVAAAAALGVVAIGASRSDGLPDAPSLGAMPVERTGTMSPERTTEPTVLPLPAARPPEAAPVGAGLVPLEAAPVGAGLVPLEAAPVGAGLVPLDRRGAAAVAVVALPALRTDAAAVSRVPVMSRIKVVTAARAVFTRAPGVPVLLTYPRLGIRAAVQPEAEVRGVLRIPEDVRRVGWDSATPRPGAPGTTLLAGHVDSKRAGDGALAPLRRARPGDLFTLALSSRLQQHWRVVAIRQVRKTGLPSTLLTLNGSPRLVLVTCGGPFDRRTGHYRDNVIVYAVQV